MTLFRQTVALALMFVVTGVIFAMAPVQYSLDEVLQRMTTAGEEFQTLQARVDRDTVNFIVNDHDLSAGMIYFAARGGESEIRLNLTEPARQDVLVAEGRFRLYNPRTNQVSEGSLGERSDIAQYLVVGFGPANASLRENFQIDWVGEEMIGDTPTSVLDLTPKSQEVLNSISRVRLWVDHERWMPIQQRLEQPSRNYQIVQYSDIRVNEGIPDSMFRLDLPDDVEIVRYN